MKRFVLIAALVGMANCLMASTSFGALQFFVDTSDVNFQAAVKNAGLTLENIGIAKGTTGITIDGMTNKTNVQIDITGNEVLRNTANNHATVVGNDADHAFTSAMILGHNVATTFLALEMYVTPALTAGGTYTVEAFGNFPTGPNTSTVFTTSAMEFLGVLATGGTVLNELTITSATAEDIANLKLIRAAVNCHAPEPTSIVIWGLTLAIGGAARWLRRPKQRNCAT